MTSPESWSVRANYWRGDRALGGHLRVTSERLVFEPHAMERALGGDTPLSCALSDVRSLARAPRSLRVPRRRLVLTMRTGEQAFLLVPKLDSVIERLTSAIEAAGGQPEVVLEPPSDLSVPEDRPDDSVMMRLIHSGWGSVVACAIWILFFLAALAGSGNPVALTALGLLTAFSAWRAWAGFRRRALIRQQASDSSPTSSAP